MKRLSDEELMPIIYQLFIESETKKEFFDELSKKTTKDHNHIKYLLEEYTKTATPEEKQKIEAAKKRHKENQQAASKSVEEICSMSEIELKEYILECNKSKKTSGIKTKFKEYIKKNGMLKEQAIKTLEKIEQICKEDYEKKKKEKAESNQQEKIEMLFTIPALGFFREYDFCREYHNQYGMDHTSLKDLIEQIKNSLKKSKPDILEKYKRLLLFNKEKAYEARKEKIKKMLLLIPNEYDIIDFYLDMDMDINTFETMIKEKLSSEDYVKFRQFKERYVDSFSRSIRQKEYTNAVISTSINGKEITPEIEELLLKFLEEHKIPNNYFIYCYYDYIEGKLDEYLNTKKR